MATKVYGASDDLIEFDGDVSGEVGCFGTDEDDHKGVLVVFDDGTILAVKYGKPGGLAIWSITAIKKGAKFDKIEVCDTDDGEDYTDIAWFKDGLKKAYAAKDWEEVA